MSLMHFIDSHLSSSLGAASHIELNIVEVGNSPSSCMSNFSVNPFKLPRLADLTFMRPLALALHLLQDRQSSFLLDIVLV